MTQFKIKAAAFRIPIMGMSEGFHIPIYAPYLVDTAVDIPWVAHNFWLLVKEENGEEQEIEAAHAFATQIKTDDQGRTVYQPIPIGHFNDFLMIHFLSKPTPEERKPWLPSDREDQVVMYEDDPKEPKALEKWRRLKMAAEVLNNDKIPYSAFGLGWGLGLLRRTINSNSGYHTLGRIMEVPIHSFKYFQPGIANTMISEPELLNLIEQIKDKKKEEYHSIPMRPGCS